MRTSKTKTENVKTKITLEDGELLNISQISRKYKLDRETVRKRLSLAKVEPHSEKAKTKVYLITEELEDLLLAESNPELNAARLRKITADAEMQELNLKTKLEKFGSVAEFSELTQQWVKWLYDRLAVKLPKAVIPKIGKAKDKASAVVILENEIKFVFNEFRANPKKFLEEK